MSDTICGNYQADILEGSILIDNGKILEDLRKENENANANE